MNTHAHARHLRWRAKANWRIYLFIYSFILFNLRLSFFPDVLLKEDRCVQKQLCKRTCIFMNMCFVTVCKPPGNLSQWYVISGQKKSTVCYIYLPGSACVPSSDAWSEAFSHGTVPLGKPKLMLVNAEPAVRMMALIYTHEDVMLSDLL